MESGGRSVHALAQANQYRPVGNSSEERKFEDMMKEAEQAAVLVLVY